jgi:N-methylhydantoinase A
VDIGGTFTDGILWDSETGAVAAAKVLTTPDDPARGFLAVIERLLADAGAAVADIGVVAHGTTIATNAVIEGNLAPTGLLATAGFRDVFEIARQVRADPFDVFASKPRPLVPRHLCLEVRGRMTAEGSELTPLCEDDVRAAAAAFRRAGVQAVAVCLLHSYRNAAHERRAGQVLRQALPGVPVSLSADIAAEFREFPRACTVAVNAGLMPVVGAYLRRIEVALAAARVRAAPWVMQSNGGVLSFAVARERPVYILESGPAAGVIAASHVATAVAEPDVIALDMGGTTAKVGLIRAGQPQMVSEFEVGQDAHRPRRWFSGASGYPIMTPAIDLVEVGAGGGSVAWIDSGGKLRVGPRSAGAAPGPVCYGRGGHEPTVTDANLVLGRLNPRFFLGGEMTLAVDAAEDALARLSRRLGLAVAETAMGIVEIANAAMVRAIRIVTVQRGYDPRRFALVASGGAGPLHAVALATDMHLPQVIVPPRPGLASALGLLATDLRHEYAATRIERLDRVQWAELEHLFASMEQQGRTTLAQEGVGAADMTFLRRLDLRYYGQSYQLTTPLPPGLGRDRVVSELARAFGQAHEAAYGYAAPAEPVEVVNVRLTAVGAVKKPSPVPGGRGARGEGESSTVTRARRRVFFRGAGFMEIPVLDRYRLVAGQRFDGPVIVEERDSTSVVLPGWGGTIDLAGNMILRRR